MKLREGEKEEKQEEGRKSEVGKYIYCINV